MKVSSNPSQPTYHCSSSCRSLMLYPAGLDTDVGDNVYCRDAGGALASVHSRRSSSGTVVTESGGSQFYSKVIIWCSCAVSCKSLTPVSWIVACQFCWWMIVITPLSVICYHPPPIDVAVCAAAKSQPSSLCGHCFCNLILFSERLRHPVKLPSVSRLSPS